MPLRDLPQPFRMPEDKRRPFVDRGAASATYGERTVVEAGIGQAVDLVEQLPLGFFMSLSNRFRRDADRVAQRKVISPPIGNVTVEEGLQAWRGPSRGMDTVGDRAYGIARKHRPRHLAVPFSDPVYVMTQGQPDPGHVERVVTTSNHRESFEALASQDRLGQLQGTSPHYLEHCGPKSAKPLQRKAVRSMERVGIGKSKRKSRFKPRGCTCAVFSPDY